MARLHKLCHSFILSSFLSFSSAQFSKNRWGLSHYFFWNSFIDIINFCIHVPLTVFSHTLSQISNCVVYLFSKRNSALLMARSSFISIGQHLFFILPLALHIRVFKDSLCFVRLALLPLKYIIYKCFRSGNDKVDTLMYPGYSGFQTFHIYYQVI